MGHPSRGAADFRADPRAEDRKPSAREGNRRGGSRVLADFGARFLPTLSEFVGAIKSDPDDARRFRDVQRAYAGSDEVSNILLSPVGVTGQLKSLLITHNRWFLQEILPRLVAQPVRVREFELSPTELFRRMEFQLWMDNGAAAPPSAPHAVKQQSSWWK